jgi:hypothetical protein
MNRNLVGSIYGRSSIKIAHFVLIGLQTWPCFLPSFVSFDQAILEEKIFKNRPIRNQNCLCRPYLLMVWDKMSTLYKGHSIDVSYQVSVHLAEGFQRRRLKCEKLTDDGRQMPSDGKSSLCIKVYNKLITCSWMWKKWCELAKFLFCNFIFLEIASNWSSTTKVMGERQFQRIFPSI